MQGSSLRRRVAVSLALVRLILVPVIFLAIYYLFAMGWIVDRIVSVDAPVAAMAERASIEMMDARRAEQNFFLLHDPEDVDTNRQSLLQLEQLISQVRNLQPKEQAATDAMDHQLKFYRERFDQAVRLTGGTQQGSVESLRKAVRAYQKGLDDLLKRAPRQTRTQLIDDLRNRIGSFDAEITATAESDDPQVRQTSLDLRTSSQQIIALANDLEKRSWERVVHDHEDARALIRRAEWVLSIVSAMTILLSVWVSFTLPRQVVKPLADLKQAVDNAAAGNYEIEFELQGGGEMAQLANSVRNLIGHLREKKPSSGSMAKS